MPACPQGGGVNDDLAKVGVDFRCALPLQEDALDMVHSCPDGEIAVGVLEVIRHPCFVRGLMRLVTFRSEI